MGDPASSNANGNFSKSTIVKTDTTFTSPKTMVLLPPLDLQSRILSLEFHGSSPRPLPQTPFLPRKLPKKQVTSPDCMDLELTFCTRPNVPDARAVRALELAPSAFDADHSGGGARAAPPRGRSHDEMCFTPAPTFERDSSLMSNPPALEREESRVILHSPTVPMPHELFVPDDF